jgi:hypothetical protein
MDTTLFSRQVLNMYSIALCISFPQLTQNNCLRKGNLNMKNMKATKK